jgi:hypothetical protein
MTYGLNFGTGVRPVRKVWTSPQVIVTLEFQLGVRAAGPAS